jgi:DNA-directed RNA polymerase subunit RPC12/RpoP
MSIVARVLRSRWWTRHLRSCFYCGHRGLVRAPDPAYDEVTPRYQMHKCPRCGEREIVPVNT